MGRWASGLARLAAAAVVACLAGPTVGWAGDAPPDRAETLVLQQRLSDAGCYHGALDGAPSAAFDAAVKQCPDMKPFLRIETGMHTAQIKSFGVDAACTLMATPSYDKTVRLWSLPDGRLERTIRLPMGDGDEGKVFAAALSPDGRTLAAGGYDATYVKSGAVALYVVDLGSDRVRRFGKLPTGITAIAFSPDGTRIAVGLGGNAGLRVFDAASGAQVLADTDYAADIYGLAYAPDGALIATSEDGAVRRYRADLKLEQKRAGLPGRHPFGVAVSPDGRTVAVGYLDEPKVSLLDAKTLRTIAEADTRGLTNGDLSSVAWSADGSQLVAGGQAQALTNGKWRMILRRFTPDGRRLGADVPAAANTITDVRRCGDGFMFAAGDPAFGRLGHDGSVRTLQGPRTADMRAKVGDAFSVSADAAKVRFGLGLGGISPVLFDLAAATLANAPSLPAGLARARVNGLPVKNWQDNYKPTFRGAALALAANEFSRSLTIRPNGSGFALGTEWSVRAYDAAGKLLWQQPGPGPAGGVDYSGDGRTLVVAYGDGTIRWLNAADGRELLALFVEPQSRKWVAWTPSGYYMASPGGEDLIGWQLNRGWQQLADFFPASRFSNQFNRPDIVQLALKTHDEAEAIKQANAAARRQASAPISALLPPVVTLLSPQDGTTVTGDTLEVKVEARSPTGAPIDRIDALIDGRPVATRGLAPAAPAGRETATTTRTLMIAVPAHDFELAVVARSGDLVSEAAKARLHYQGAARPADALKPKLYAVTIGVSDYVDPQLQLGYAAADAQGFAAALQRQKGGLYSDVEIKTLVDRQATRANVIDALDWLDAQVTSRDIGIVLIAGHGVTDLRGRYWFLPADVFPKHLGATAVSQEDIRRDMSEVAGKAVLFLDTCHANREVTGRGGAGAASVDTASLVNDFAKTENGLVTFAASQGSELSQESARWRHGAFTEALIEGVGEGKADLLHRGTITVSELDAYIDQRVKELTDGRQHPVMSRPATVPDFAFALAR